METGEDGESSISATEWTVDLELVFSILRSP